MKVQSLVGATAALAICLLQNAYAEQPSAPCHPNPNAAADSLTVRTRGDIAGVPDPLKDRLVRLADRPHTFLPMQVFAEADQPGRLVQYYLLDTDGFEPNVFTTIFPGINDAAQLSVTGGNCGLPTLGTVRVILELKPGLPTNPTDAKAFLDVFTDISAVVRDQQRERVVRRLDDSRSCRARYGIATQGRPRAIRQDYRTRCC